MKQRKPAPGDSWVHRLWRPSIAIFHWDALCFESSNQNTFFGYNAKYIDQKEQVSMELRGEAKSLTVQSLKCDGLETWMLRSSEWSDQIMFAFITNFAWSTYINFGLLVRISWTFLLVNLCTFFTIEIIRTDSPGSKNCCLLASGKYILDYENLHAKLLYPSKWMIHYRYNNG